MTEWVSYAQLREELDIAEVMSDCGVELRGSGDQRKGNCPLCEPDDPSSRSLSVNVKKGLWKCFHCNAGGSVLDFAARVQGVDPNDREALRKVAMGLQEKYDIEPKRKSQSRRRRNDSDTGSQQQGGDRPRRRRLVNAPLDFELRNLERDHVVVQKLGLQPETIEHFGLGYCSRRGMFQHRIAIPLHNVKGELIAYAGRIADPAEVDAKNPLYMFPDEERERKHDSAVLVFDKYRVVYSAHRLDQQDSLIVTDDMLYVWHLYEMGLTNAVALLRSASQEQVDTICQLVQPDGTVWFLTNAGEPTQTMLQVAKERAVRWNVTSDLQSAKEAVERIV